MNPDDLKKSSVRDYGLHTYLSERDPFAVYRADVGEKMFVSRAPWFGGYQVLTALPEFNFVYDLDVTYTNKANEDVVVAKLWFGISHENDHLQETLYTPCYQGDEITGDITYVLPAGSTVKSIELIKDTFYDLDEDQRFCAQQFVSDANSAEERLRGAYSGYRDTLHVLVRYKMRDGDIRHITLKRAAQGCMMMPQNAYDFWEKQALHM